jgi:hypothetical protein
MVYGNGADWVNLNDLSYFDTRHPERYGAYWEENRPVVWGLGPVDDVGADRIREKKGVVFGLNWPIDGTNFDLLPLGKSEGLLFVHDRGRMRVWHGRHSLKDRETTWKELKGDGFRARLDGPFQVFGDRSSWVFLTSTGELFIARKPLRGEGRKLERFYADAEAPVRAIPTDAATGKTYAFTEYRGPDRLRARHGYFELADGARGRAYVPRRPPKGKLREPFATLVECGHALLAERKRR